MVYVSSSRHLARSVRIYRTTRSCTLLIKGYGTYHTGAAFDVGNRDRRYPLKSPTRSYSQRLLHRFQPKPRRWRALLALRLIHRPPPPHTTADTTELKAKKAEA